MGEEKFTIFFLLNLFLHFCTLSRHVVTKAQCFFSWLHLFFLSNKGRNNSIIFRFTGVKMWQLALSPQQTITIWIPANGAIEEYRFTTIDTADRQIKPLLHLIQTFTFLKSDIPHLWIFFFEKCMWFDYGYVKADRKHCAKNLKLEWQHFHPQWLELLVDLPVWGII